MSAITHVALLDHIAKRLKTLNAAVQASGQYTSKEAYDVHRLSNEVFDKLNKINNIITSRANELYHERKESES